MITSPRNKSADIYLTFCFKVYYIRINNDLKIICQTHYKKAHHIMMGFNKGYLLLRNQKQTTLQGMQVLD